MQKGIIFCGHGTKSQEGISSFFKVYKAIEQRFISEYRVNYGFIEYVDPNLAEAILRQINQGVKEIIILPALLFPGVHTSHDIPYIVQTILKEHPDIKIKLAPTLDLSEKIVEICLQQIEQQLNAVDGVADKKHLLVIGVGSSKPEANIKIASLTRVLWENLPFNYASYAFISRMTFPSIDQELKRFKQMQASHIVALPVILFPGVYLDKISLLIENFNQSFDGQVQVCNPFDENDLLVEAFIDRFNEVLSGNEDWLSSAEIIVQPRK